MTSVHELLGGASHWLWPMMLHHFWQAAWFSGVAWFLCLLARRAPARTRYWIWLLASFKCALPAVFLVWIATSLNIRVPWPVNAVSQSSTRVIAEFPLTSHSDAPAVDVSNRSPNATRTGGHHAELYCALTLVWGLGTVFCLAVLSKRRLALKSVLRRGKLLISGRAVDALRRIIMKNQLKQQRPLTLLVSSDFSEPGVCGTWKPTLVLPRGMVEALTDDELEVVMLHELVHVQHRDNLVSTFQSWLCGVFWFYPVVWLIDRQLLVERELACDEEVLATTHDSQNYLSSLIKVFRLSLGGTMAGVSLATGSNLKRRIHHMQSHHSRKNVVVLHRLMVFGFALALTVSLIGGAALLNQGKLVAQENPASLSGTVFDASGATIPQATIIVSHRESQTKEITLSGPAGEYEFRGLPAGRYSLEARKSGFRPYQVQTFDLNANQAASFIFRLEVGEVIQTVDVVGKAPQAAPQRAFSGPPRRIRVGGNVQQTKLVHQVQPVYPERAQAEGIQGSVLLEAIISKDGSIGAMRVLNKLTDPELVDAAVEAVKNWRYEPTLLNGQPIEIVTMITVNFRLSSS